jgi:nicotinamide-nucleotide amidase
LVTGDEVLLGRTPEANARYLAADLDRQGVSIAEIRLVPDVLEVLVTALQSLVGRVDLVVTTGGLGPTHDDLTMEAVALACGRPLTLNQKAQELVHARLARIPGRMLEGSDEAALGEVKQATLPAGGQVLAPIGTAPGCLLEVDGCTVVILPGPPSELQPMWHEACASAPLSTLLEGAPVRDRRILRLSGVMESEFVTVRNRLDPALVAAAPHGVYTRSGELEVVIDVDAPAPAAAFIAEMSKHFQERLFATDGEEVDHLVAVALTGRSERLALAESCTGGGLGARLTAMPGASAWFIGGVIAYDNEVKERLLAVEASLLAAHGAVSLECAEAMAFGARAATGAEWGLSITGIAGPDGGTPEKPVGLVYIGCVGPQSVEVAELRLPGDRERVRLRAQTLALHLLRRALLAS